MMEQGDEGHVEPKEARLLSFQEMHALAKEMGKGEPDKDQLSVRKVLKFVFPFPLTPKCTAPISRSPS